MHTYKDNAGPQFVHTYIHTYRIKWLTRRASCGVAVEGRSEAGEAVAARSSAAQTGEGGLAARRRRRRRLQGREMPLATQR